MYAARQRCINKLFNPAGKPAANGKKERFRGYSSDDRTE
jgi:hypothetical protein